MTGTEAAGQRPGALQGVRVIDLTMVLMGPLATRMLADHGADVVKLEPPTGDPTRNSLPARHPGMSGFAMNLHRNKRSVALDLKTPGGRAAAQRLMDSADVVVTNMRRAALERLGLDPATLRARRPDLIYCVANGYGSDGPYAARAAYDDVIQAASGLSWLIGEVRGEPGYVPTVLADKISGLTIVQAVMAALLHRERTGEGQEIEVPMFETLVAFNLVEHLRGLTFEPPAGPFGYDRLLTRFRRPFRTADGWACLVPYNDANWRAFFSFCDRPELIDDPRFATHNARIAHIDELYGLVDQLAVRHTTAEWMRFCEQASVPAAPVLDLSRAEEDVHLAQVGLISQQAHPTEGVYRHVRDSVRYSATPTQLHRHAPRLGQHTREVLAEVGYDGSAIEKLLAAGAAVQA
jgi:crotonobetainyl-CoA:carnitine CoA-transferase CaiB-like acyl-CoA transferase